MMGISIEVLDRVVIPRRNMVLPPNLNELKYYYGQHRVR